MFKKRLAFSIFLVAFFACSLFCISAAFAKNPSISNWTKNLSSNVLLEKDGTTWNERFSVDIQASGKNFHALWYGNKDGGATGRFVYRQSLKEGVSWKAPRIITTSSDHEEGTLNFDSTDQHICVSGSNIHIVVPWDFGVSNERWWHSKLYYFRSNDNGATFKPERLLVDSGDAWDISHPRIVCNEKRVVIGYSHNFRNGPDWEHRISLLISDILT